MYLSIFKKQLHWQKVPGKIFVENLGILQSDIVQWWEKKARYGDISFGKAKFLGSGETSWSSVAEHQQQLPSFISNNINNNNSNTSSLSTTTTTTTTTTTPILHLSATTNLTLHFSQSQRLSYSCAFWLRPKMPLVPIKTFGNVPTKK